MKKATQELFFVVRGRGFRPNIYRDGRPEGEWAPYSLDNGHLITTRQWDKYVENPHNKKFEPRTAIIEDNILNVTTTFHGHGGSFLNEVWGPYTAESFQSGGLWYTAIEQNRMVIRQAGKHRRLEIGDAADVLMEKEMEPALQGIKLLTLNGDKLTMVDPIDIATVLVDSLKD